VCPSGGNRLGADQPAAACPVEDHNLPAPKCFAGLLRSSGRNRETSGRYHPDANDPDVSHGLIRQSSAVTAPIGEASALISLSGRHTSVKRSLPI
jgi:hypothetical protein